MSRELIEVLCTHSIKLSSLHCLRTSKRSSMGGRWSKCIVLPMVLRSKKKGKKRGREKRKKMNDDEKLLGSFSFIKLHYHTLRPYHISVNRRGIPSITTPPVDLIVVAGSKHPTPIILASDRKSLDFYRTISLAN